MKWKEKIPGGKADGKKPTDYDSDDVNIGSKVQQEHSPDIDTEEEITIDHLEEFPDY